MERLLRRTRTAERAVAKRNKKRDRLDGIIDKKRRLQEQRQVVPEIKANLRAARQARRDAWDLGPLAPALDLGTHEHGVIVSQSRRGATRALRPFQIEERCRWAGTPQYLNLVPKDRVVILEGPDKGKIDEVASIQMDTATVELKKLSKVNIQTPRFVPGHEENPVVSVAYRLPISAVRLVHPLRDPQSGVVRDVVIHQLARGPVLWDRHSGFRSWRRFVPGLNVTIPWPERDVPERRDTAADTPAEVVSERTFVPTLLRPPVPSQIVDELRNRYSRFRTRHEDWYVAKAAAEVEAQKAARKISPAMLTPQEEAALVRKEERRARGQPELSDEMLERIGRVIALNKAAALDAAGLSEVSRETHSPPS